MAQLAVIGPGAIGTWLAYRLSAAGPVMLVGRDRRWLRAASRGLRVWEAGRRRPSGPKSGRVRPTLAPRGKADAVFLCVKSRDTAAALRRLRPLLGPDTAVVSLQNGLAHAAPILRAVGPRRAVLGACYAAVGRKGLAEVRHHAGRTVMLGRTGRNSAATARAREWLLRAGLDVPAPAREDRVLWTKAAFNAATNAVGALAARPNGALAELPPLWAIVARALREASSVARAAGHPPLVARMEPLVRSSCRAAPRQENSMLQDLRAGRPTEADAILKPFLDEARRRRRAIPTLDALYRFVAQLERELGKGGA